MNIPHYQANAKFNEDIKSRNQLLEENDNTTLVKGKREKDKIENKAGRKVIPLSASSNKTFRC